MIILDDVHGRLALIDFSPFCNAVKRNRCKRRLREAVYKYNDRLLAGFDLVFVARSYAREEPFDELCRDVGMLLNKANVLKK